MTVNAFAEQLFTLIDEIAEDVANVTIVFVSFVFVILVHKYLSEWVGLSFWSAFAVALSVAAAIAAVFTTVWALWSRLVDRVCLRPEDQTSSFGNDTRATLHQLLATRRLPDIVITGMTISGLLYLPWDRFTQDWDFQQSFTVFYGAVAVIAPLRRRILQRLRPAPRDPTTPRHTLISSVFE